MRARIYHASTGLDLKLTFHFRFAIFFILPRSYLPIAPVSARHTILHLLVTCAFRYRGGASCRFSVGLHAGRTRARIEHQCRYARPAQISLSRAPYDGSWPAAHASNLVLKSDAHARECKKAPASKARRRSPQSAAAFKTAILLILINRGARNHCWPRSQVMQVHFVLHPASHHRRS